jgi:cell division transport system permease protein
MGVVIAFTVIVLILLVALATTVFATRTSLLVHRQVIEVLSLIGATPAYIAKQFQMNALKQGFIASTIGSVLGFLTFIGIGTFLEKGELPFVMDSILFSQALCVFICAPFLTALLMMISVRFSVMRALRL